MAIKLKCPSCRERLFAEESDRGGSIKCPGCETRVPVPAGDGSAPPPPTLAKAVVPTVPVLKPVRPADDDVVDAEVITAPVLKAKSSAAIPTVAPLPEPETRKPKSRTGFRLRGEDDRDDDRPRRRDEDDEDDDREPAEKGGNGLLFVLLGVGVLLLGGIGVGVYFLTAGDDNPPVVENTTPDGVIPGPVGPKPNPNPGGVKPGAGGMPDGWDVVTGDSFTIHAPKANLSEGPFAARGLAGRIWTSRELGGAVVCSGAYLERMPGVKPGALLDVAREAFTLNGGKLDGVRVINGRSCSEFSFPGGSRVWVHVTEEKLFLFRFTADGGNPETVVKRDHFQANIKVTHPVGNVDGEPVDPGPVGPGPGPVGPKPPPKPVETPSEPVPTVADVDGFTVEMPGGAKVKGERHVYKVEGKYSLGGKKYEVKDGEYTFRLYYHDLVEEGDYEANKFLEPLLPFPWKPAGGVDGKVAGQPGQAWSIKHLTFQNTTPAATVQVGFRVFSLFVTKDGLPHGQGEDPIAAERGKKFIDSLKVTFDPKKAAAEAVDPRWQPMARTVGFTATGPRGTTDEDYNSGFGFDQPKGKHFSCEDDTVKCHVYIVQMGPKHDPDKTLKDMVGGIHGREKVVDGPNKITHGGAAGEEMTVLGFPFNNKMRVRTFLYGTVAVMLKVEGKGDQPEREVMLKARAFFAGFKYGGGGGAVGPGPGPVVVGNGEFASAGKVSPFWTALVLPAKKELLALGARNPADPKPGGVLRRYSYPDFKLKATYHLPLPVNRAVADEKTGKLVCSVIGVWPVGPQALDLREAASWTSDLHVFDLRKITDGTLVEGEEVKPVGAKIAIGQPISGLEVEPAGGFVYASAVVIAPFVKGVPPRAPSGRVYKIDTNKGEVSGTPINHPEPLDGLRMAPFGGTLVTSETAVGPRPPGKQTNLLTVDPVAWKKAKLIPIAAPAKDLTFSGDGILALVAADAKTLVYGYADGAAETIDVSPKEIPLDGFGYLRVTANGKWAVAAAGMKQNGLLLMKVTGSGDKAKFEKVSSGNTVAGMAVGGSFVLTPDSKYAVFNCGAVVDLEKTTAQPKGKE